MRRGPTPLDPKDTAELDLVTFDFGPAMSAAESIVSVAVTCDVHSGTDPTPAALLSAQAQIAARNIVTQEVTQGVAGVAYHLRATATLNSGRVLVLAARLAVVDL